MSEKKNIVEEALIQMKNLESIVSENAKGILASTMKEEISQLVKESLSEQDDDEVDTDVDIDMDLEPAGDEDMDMDTDNEDEVDMDMDIDMDMDTDSEEPIDLTDVSDEEILKIFKRMSDEDGVIVTQDDDEVHITDNDEDVEYIVQLGESEEMEEMEIDEDDSLDAIMDELFGDGGLDPSEVDVDFKVDPERDNEDDPDEELVFEIEFDEEDMDEEWNESDDENMVYELEMDEEDEMEEGDESYSPEKVEEAKMTITPKGKTGNGPKKVSFSGENIHKGPKGKSSSEAKKFVKGEMKEEDEDGEMMERGGRKGDIKGTLEKVGHHGKGPKRKETAKEEGDIDYEETKEAARTYGFGSKEGRGLRKGITNNRNHVYENEKLKTEVSKLNEKNEEYRKALNIFREKLQEVAVFNSNLAYATRLFTEHSTTKKEKINILRRFDDAETMKESKNLYKQIKEELSGSNADVVTESVEKIIDKAPSSGSAQSLIESKTYENPQFLRMKDLMQKIK
jgi:hypothetical protein